MDVGRWLSQNAFFGSLSEEELDHLATELVPRAFGSGDIIFRQGDVARSLLVVVHGRIEVFTPSQHGGELLLGEVGPGELFGEIGLIAGEVRSATGRAIRDLFALELSESSYKRLLATHQELVMRLIRLVLQRVRGQTQKPARAHSVGILPLSSGTAATFAARLHQVLIKTSPAMCLDAAKVARDVPEGDLTATGLSDANQAIVSYLSDLEEEFDCLLFACDPEPSAWTLRALRQVDRIILVANPADDPGPREIERLLSSGELRGRVRTDLVLMYENDVQLIGQTLQWLALRNVEAAYFPRLGQDTDVEKLAGSLLEASRGPEWLRGSGLFASFDEHDLRSIAGELETVHLRGRETLFEKGAPGDSLFMVVSGRLQALMVDAQGNERVLGEMGPGEVIGEIALLTGEARSATVRAIRDTRLAKLPKRAFDRQAMQQPQLVFQLARIVVERLSGRRRKNSNVRSLNFAVLPLSPGLDLRGALESLTAAFGHLGRVRTVGRAALEDRLGQGAAEIDQRHPGDPTVVEWLNQLEGEFDYLLYQCDPEITPWTLRCLRQADRILLVAAAGDAPEFRRIEQQIAIEFDVRQAIPTYLVLVHPSGTTEGSGTLAWLEPRPLKQHFHARHGHQPDFDRIARLLTNRAFGLTLGGGGSRGVAHVGAYRAMLEAKVPIDIISGVSAGAGIAGLIAMADPPAVALEKVRQMLVSYLGHLFSLGPPLVSMMSGRHPNRLLQPWFGDRRIEDQFIPCIITSVDLVGGTQRVHQTGLLRQAARASSSLPGAWPPVTEEGRLLVDGGVLNNLPVDMVLQQCRDGFVVASDIATEPDYNGYAEYGYELSGWALLTDSLLPFRTKRKVASLMDVISRCCTLASSTAVQKYMSDERVLYLAMPVGNYGMFAIRDTALVKKVEQDSYDFAHARLVSWCEKFQMR